MPFTVPQIAHASQRQLVREALDRVPSHTPEWTNLNDSDPGVTLVQLFAFLAESIGYRANLIPERNRAKFFDLLGVEMRAAAAARGLVAFDNQRGPLAPVTLGRDSEVLAGRVPFRTEHGLTVLPVTAKLYYKARLDDTRWKTVESLYRRLYSDLEESGNSLDYYESRAFETPAGGVTLPALDLADTVDGAAWLALLARPGESPEAAREVIGGKVLTLGVVPALDESSKVVPPEGSEPPPGGGLAFHAPRETADGGVRYDRLEARASADLTVYPGTVELRLPAAARLAWGETLDPLEPGVGELPPALADSEDGKRLVAWLRIRAAGEMQGGADAPAAGTPATGAGESPGQLSLRLSGVWGNAAEVAQRARVPAEPLPAGSGEPHQAVTLLHTPVLPESLTLTVNGELWQPIDDLAAAAAEVPPKSPRLAGTEATAPAPRPGSLEAPAKSYTLDRESGVIRFGDGAHGARPPRGAVIVAAYAYGGGRQGMVGIGAIAKGPNLPAGIKVTNPAPTWGGDEAETVADAEYRIPRVLRHRDRLVAADDFADIAWETPGVDLGRVEVLPLYHPDLGGAPAEGVVTLLLIPLYDAEHPDNPVPDRLFLDAVCRHLRPRRLVTTELHLRGPDYRDLWLSAGVEVVQGQEQGPVLERVEIELRRFLSPLAGGFDGRGWPLDKAVEAGELLATATRVPGVSRVRRLLLGNTAGGEITRLELAGLELPRLAGIAVTAGDPLPLDDLLGAETPVAGTPRRLPVPVIPEDC